ncbi:MAG TPA: tyrosine-type recombinase/integrase [Pirellulales bacterium]|jgi:integrase|nr:tyrosine-type recombinase/integrase [Pirellulales bacterium]
MTRTLTAADTLLADFYRDVFRPLALRSRAPNTLRLYESTIRSFARCLKRSPLLGDLNDDTVSRYLDWFKRQGGGRSPYSVNRERNNVLAIWRYACRKGLIAIWPDVAPEREPRHVPQAWLGGELTRLLATCQTMPGRIGRVRACHWWTALHLVLWNSGERIGALMRLTWDCVDLKDGWLRMPAALRKGGTEDKLFRLLPETVAALRAIRHGRDGKVFAWPYSATYLWLRYKKLLKRAGLPHDKKSMFHRMRRSVASHAEAAGANATELLGHSCRKVTLSYLDPRLTGHRFASDVLFQIGGDTQPSGEAKLPRDEPALTVLFRRYCTESLMPRVSDQRHLRRSITAIENCIDSGIRTLADVTTEKLAEHLQQLQLQVGTEGFQRHRAAIGQFLRWLDEVGLSPAAADVLRVLGIKTHRWTIGGVA